MTLDEQLREHLDHQETCGWHLDWPQALTALRAVLNLHQPEPALVFGGAPVCSHCVDATEEPVRYPCVTVQAVAAALEVRPDTGSSP